jgi:post-segregation antitoxin (ccd killing protein)
MKWWGWLSTAVLSVRVRKELKEEAKRLNINLKEVVERALEEEIRRARMERMRELVEEALRVVDLKEEEWVRAVKESRIER